jgi:hypothetical protein
MNLNENEQKALDCLIAFTLRDNDQFPEDILKDAKEYENKKVNLPKSFKSILKNLADNIFQKASVNAEECCNDMAPDPKYKEAFIAMHRGKSSQDIDVETEKEIQARRLKIADEEKKKRKKADDKQD